MRADLPIGEAVTGVAILAAPNADTEARAIALAARATLASGRTVGIISRDQTLARRIAVELKRHGIIVDDAAGTPLYQSAAGRLARQILAVAASNYAPVDTIALLHNGAVSLGLQRSDVRRCADHLDLRLRSQRPTSGLDGLLKLTDNDAVRDLLNRLGAALQAVTAQLAEP
jgi:ATP-dependent helicase/nuclease subunit B